MGENLRERDNIKVLDLDINEMVNIKIDIQAVGCERGWD